MTAKPYVILFGAALFWLMIPAAGLADEPTPWHLYAGAVHFGWSTTGGVAGHLDDCNTRVCEDQDFERGNLDGSIGFRAGLEREIIGNRHFALLFGVEGSALFSEYNLSQDSIVFSDLHMVTGAKASLGRFAIFGRVGAGVMYGDQRWGETSFVEYGLELDLGRGVALRPAYRRARHDVAYGKDLSLVLMASPGFTKQEGRWEISSSGGVSEPGGAVGRDLALRSAPFWQFGVSARIGATASRLGLVIDTAAFESRLESLWINTPGNQRSRDVFGAALHYDIELATPVGLGVRLGGGIKWSDWSDDWPLLVDPQGNPVMAGTGELAGLIKAEVILRPAGFLPLVIGVEQLYWPSPDLGELRYRLGILIPL